MTSADIALRNVTRRYGAHCVLNDVSFTAPAARVLALLGASGSGKSTALRLIAGLEPVDAGAVVIGAETVSAPGRTLPAEQRRIGFVFQEYALFPHMSVAANVAFGLQHVTPADRESCVRAWLARVGLGHRLEAFPHELSGGEQQRVALARALAPAPRAVLLDEPFSGLDPVLRTELRGTTLAAIAEAGATAIFVTHDADEALLVADRLAILKAGRLVQEGAPREAYDQPVSEEAAAALGPINVFDAHVAMGALATPFGAIATTLPEGAPARAVVRAECIALTPGTRARIIARRPHGAHDYVRIEAAGVTWSALIAPASALGDTCDVTLAARGAFVFARQAP